MSLAVAWRAQEGRSDLLVIDAAKVAAGPVATVMPAAPDTVRLSRHLARQRLIYRPSKLAGRLARKACMPSFCAGVPNAAWK